MTEQDRQMVLEGKKHLVVYGLVEYDDILNKHHCFAFGCRYRAEQGDSPERFEPIGQNEFWRYA